MATCEEKLARIREFANDQSVMASRTGGIYLNSVPIGCIDFIYDMIIEGNRYSIRDLKNAFDEAKQAK